jgi:hypothetical protein
VSIREQYEKETGKKCYGGDCNDGKCAAYLVWLEARVEGKGINGTLLMVGTMKIDGEELTGCFVECSRETLQNYPVSILYKNCTIIPTQPPAGQGD